jgi:2-(1,2-epoxy-1,2-dihydrophenyl)acetyl-CoA isomerase
MFLEDTLYYQLPETAMDYRALIAACCADTRRLIDVKFEEDGAIAIVRLQDPERANALSPTLCWQLRETLQALSQDPVLRVLVLTGADPAFCAGGDLDFIASAQTALREGDEGAVTIWRWIRQQFGGVARILAGMEA